MQVLETPTARSSDPVTSFGAADGITSHQITVLQTAILEALAEKPLTHDELVLAVHALGVTRTPQRIRTSCKELTRAGLVRTETLGRSLAGNKSQRWELDA